MELSAAHPRLTPVGSIILAELVARVLGFDCELFFDTSRQDGTPQKLLDVSRIHALGWKAKVNLEEGLRRTYAYAQTELERCTVTSF